MDPNVIFWPMLVQVALTLTVFSLLGFKKQRALKLRLVDRDAAALDNQAWPKDVVKVSNNIANQFESPVLFYALCLLLHSINAVGVIALILAWLYVLSRVMHAYVHLGSNYVPLRFKTFLFGCTVLLAMTVLTVVGLAAR